MYGLSREEFIGLFTQKSWYESHKLDCHLDPLDLQLMEDGKVSVEEVQLELEERRLHERTDVPIQTVC